MKHEKFCPNLVQHKQRKKSYLGQLLQTNKHSISLRNHLQQKVRPLSIKLENTNRSGKFSKAEKTSKNINGEIVKTLAGSHFLEMALILREFLRRPVDDPDTQKFNGILKKRIKTEISRKIPKPKWKLISKRGLA